MAASICQTLSSLASDFQMPRSSRSRKASGTPVPDRNWLATIHHGLPLTLLPFTERSEEYLAFLGRIDPEKGPDVAIRVARCELTAAEGWLALAEMMRRVE